MKIKLLNNSYKKWCKVSESYIKGFAYYNDHLLTEYELYESIVKAIDENSIVYHLNKLNGNYSAVINFGKSTYLVSDKFKTYPILYTKEINEYIITDQAEIILKERKSKIFNEVNLAELLSITYLDDDKTILEDVNIVNAGTFIRIDLETSSHEKFIYHRHIYSKNNLTPSDVLKEGVAIADNAFRKIFNSIGDRRIVIPLSGGYDSRWIACMCKRFGKKNVLCYTYGFKGSWEVTVSEKVAKELNFEWHFVEYTYQMRNDLYRDLEYYKYLIFAQNLNTLSHPQDYIAIRELLNKKIINAEDVIFPGHSGEILGGDQIPYSLLNKNFSVAELLYKHYGIDNLKKKYRNKVLDSFSSELKELNSKFNNDLACDLYNNWNIQSRQSNFIINSVRIYDFFNIDWRIPLWEDELTKFWLSIMWKYKTSQDLYNKFLFITYFEPMNVAYYKSDYTANSIFSKIRLPLNFKAFVKNKLLKLGFFNNYFDPNGANDLISLIGKSGQDLKNKYLNKKSYNSNQYLTAYLIELIKKYEY